MCKRNKSTNEAQYKERDSIVANNPKEDAKKNNSHQDHNMRYPTMTMVIFPQPRFAKSSIISLHIDTQANDTDIDLLIPISLLK